ncbi:MAG: hypothetical protein IBX71_04905 [Candidatus Desulforudis sp.]|nr:hypothetical protein [Desulforudis sp.]
MPRIVDRRADVAADPEGRPRSFGWGRGKRRVRRILDAWKETGRWWAGETEKIFYRVETESGGVYELYTDRQDWYLYKIYD